MNCIEFKLVVTDLAYERPMNATMRQEALKHSARCPACAERFAAERSLVDAFRQWAKADSTAEAPERVEANLKNAFRMTTKRQAHDRRTALWLGGIAAAIVLVIAGMRLFQRSASVTAPPAKMRQAEPEQMNPAQYQRPEYAQQKAKPATPTAREVDGSQQQAGNSTTTLATEFLPLSYADNSAPIGNGEVVRVEMPASALVQIGVPPGPGQTREPVTADILLDQHGAARAIRFVSGTDVPLR